MRNANEGISLAAIVAKETTTGKWNGTGGGIGLGTGGIGLFIGGVSGSKQEQTQRAKNFESPKEEEYSLLNVYGSIIKVLVFGVLFGLSARLFTFLSDTGSDFAEPVTTTTATGKIQSILGGMAEMVSILGTVVPFLVIIIAMIWFLFFSSKREKEELTRVEREAAKTKLRIDVYHRLRYVESDHVVFDPITGREVPAERACINKLIEALADGQNHEGYDEMYRKKHHLIKIFLLKMACNVFSFLLGAFILSAPFVLYTLTGSVLNAVIHFTFSLPLATILLVYAYSGFEESIYLFMAYKYDSSKS